jgi:iron(III) transport system substrate-binding protein
VLARSSIAALFAAASLAACGADAPRPDAADPDGGVVSVYSHRHYESDQELFRRFTEATGIEVKVVTASADELITRLEAEGAASPADVLITVDAGRLHRAKERGLLQPVDSEVLRANVPAHLRDPEGYWYGLTRRARVIVYARDRVQPGEITRYADLADERWRGRVLVRSSDNIYNQSLLASLIAHEGEDAARAWAAGVARNMARPPSGSDTDQAKAVAAGVGDVAIVNTYYVARLMGSADPEARRVGERLGVVFPEQDGRGAHVNVSGAGVTAHAKNRENAIRLLEFLSGDEAQRVFAEANHEYPVKPGTEPSAILRSWGEFRADTLNLAVLGELNSAAVRIFDEVGWK